MFVEDFNDQIGCHATLVDPNNNEFEVLVKRFNGSVFFFIKRMVGNTDKYII